MPFPCRLLRLAGPLALVLLPAVPTAAQERIAITPVTVVDVREGALLRDQTVLIEGERISAVGRVDAVAVPAGAARIDGTGKYLIPGLWDMHVHTSSDRITREVLYPLFIAHGVTGVRNMRADCFPEGPGACGPLDSSIEQVRERRRDVEAGGLVGPREEAGSAFANGPGSDGISTQQGAGTPEDARAFVRLSRERGVDFLKVYDLIPRAAYFALADEAVRLGLPFAGHVPVSVRASEASDAGQRSIEHLGAGNVLDQCSTREDELRPKVQAELAGDDPRVLPLMLEMVRSYDPGKCAALFARFVENGTWVTPTLIVSRLPKEIGDGWLRDPRMRYVPPEERALFEEMQETMHGMVGAAEAEAPYTRWVRRVAGEMQRAGVPLLAGSDAGYPGIFWGSSIHEELELLVSVGLSEAEALRAATIGPAAFLMAADSLGTVEVGRAADLVLLEEDPLADISNTQRIAAVCFRGRCRDRRALDALLAEVERKARAGEMTDEAR